MTREERTWRRLALAGAGTVALLVARLVMIRAGESRSAFEIVRRTFSQPVGEDDLFSETRAQEFERRLHAVEVHLQNLPPERGA